MVDKVDTTPVAKADDKPEYKVVEVRDDGTAMVGMEDGRVFPATLKDGVEVKKGTKVTIASTAVDKDGAPTDANITRAH